MQGQSMHRHSILTPPAEGQATQPRTAQRLQSSSRALQRLKLSLRQAQMLVWDLRDPWKTAGRLTQPKRRLHQGEAVAVAGVAEAEQQLAGPGEASESGYQKQKQPQKPGQKQSQPPSEQAAAGAEDEAGQVAVQLLHSRPRLHS